MKKVILRGTRGFFLFDSKYISLKWQFKYFTPNIQSIKVHESVTLGTALIYIPTKRNRKYVPSVKRLKDFKILFFNRTFIYKAKINLPKLIYIFQNRLLNWRVERKCPTNFDFLISIICIWKITKLNCTSWMWLQVDPLVQGALQFLYFRVLGASFA